MELFRTNEFYIFINGEHSLWWDRLTGIFIPKTGTFSIDSIIHTKQYKIIG